MSITIDSNAPYATSFGAQHAEDAVYMSAEDPLLGQVMAVVYKSVPTSTKMSVILLGNHGTSGYVDMTLDASSRYYGACRGLAAAHFASPVRKALAIAALRTFATMDKPLRRYLLRSTFGELYDEQAAFKYYDEAAAGALGSRFRLVHGKFPSEIGKRILEAGFLEAKRISTGNVDIIYEDSDFTIDQNNDLVYMLGEQLEQLFDPLSEYSPEPTEKVYTPPTDSLATLEDDTDEVREICEELYILQSHVRSDLVALLQEFLIPLRVRVLSGEIPELTIGILNTLFPPTIDEVFRITNLFYDALQQALPFGSFEVLRACGTTIPYFYRASMRHEAATRNFTRNLTSYSPELQNQMEHFSPQRIESIMRFSLHLARTKMILDRLMRCRVWSEDEKDLANEYYSVADSTIHSFGMQQSVSEAYNRRVFTPTGKLLVEIAEGWPTELEYGWMSRRVVTIFDAVDIIEENPARRQLHHIVILFTDAVLILEPAAPIPMASMSGLHVPAVGDMLMHAVVNEAPLDKNLPPLRVVAWAPVLEVVFAAYGERSLVVSMPGGEYSIPNSQNSENPTTTTSSSSHFYSKVYKLVRTDHVADKFVELLAKAKVTTKTQPFHLFRMAQQELQLYMTVHEGQGFNEEVNRFPLAIFLNCDISAATLKQHQLVGAVSLSFCGQSEDIRVKVVSVLGHQSDKQICRDDSREYVLSEVSYLATLALSSQNADALPPIVAGNAAMVSTLNKWAQAPPQNKALGHRRGLLTPNPNNPTVDGLSPGGTSHPNMTPSRRLSSPGQKRRLRKVPHLDNTSINARRTNSGPDYNLTAAASAGSLDRQPSLELANGASNASLSSGSHYEFPPRKSISGTRNSSRQSNLDDWESMEGDSISDDLDSADEAEQRDVDAWYHHISHRGASSLSSGVSDVDLGGSSPSTLRPIGNLNHDDNDDGESNFYGSPHSTSEAIQLGPFLTKSDSLLYNQHAGRAFAALADGRSTKTSLEEEESQDDSASEFSSRSVSRSTSLTESRRSAASLDHDDFRWLADYVSDDAEVSRSSSMNKLHLGLRDPSIVRLGNYVLSSEKSAVWNMMPNTSLLSVAAPTLNGSVAPLKLRKHTANASDASSSGLEIRSDFDYLRSEVQDQDDFDTSLDDDLRRDFLGSNEATPTLEDLHFSDSSPEETPEAGVRNILRNSRWLAALSTNNETNKRTSFEPPVQEVSKPARKSFVPRPQSVGSFSRMVMSSSLNSLQLASITVQLDQVIAAATVHQRPLLSEVKNLLVHHYGKTHEYAKSRNPDSPVDAEALREEENAARSSAAWSVWTLVSLDKQNLVSPYLEIEWHRRTLLAESLGSALPRGLWT